MTGQTKSRIGISAAPVAMAGIWIAAKAGVFWAQVAFTVVAVPIILVLSGLIVCATGTLVWDFFGDRRERKTEEQSTAESAVGGDVR
jgi:hypothetical protein